MPNQDGTGPSGEGPLTGRGLGPCNAGQIVRRGFRRGFGRGQGFQRGFRWRQPVFQEEYPERKNHCFSQNTLLGALHL